ncbi:MAG TPA: hypothetical protein DDW23_07165 [Planctomycetes bacterium]|nr:hypothetical protein [Planctomycetota bacterium]
MRIDLKTARILTSPEAQETLQLFRDSNMASLHIQESFRGLFPKKIAEALGELRALRMRAIHKFDQGEEMFFTKELLEQASSSSVAEWRAGRFKDAGIKRINDPCCGIGADSIAFAKMGLQVRASDRDEVALHFAKANAQVLGQSSISFSLTDMETDPPSAGAIFLDPSRRRGSRRLMNPKDWSPSPSAISKALKGRGAAGLKLSPAVDLDNLLDIYPQPYEIETVSLKGEAKETLFWYGKVGEKGVRRATLLPSGESWAGNPGATRPVGELSDWIYDPDPALTRSGLLADFANEHGLHLLDKNIGYLTGKHVKSSFLKSFRVIDCETLDPRKMKAKLRQHKVGRLLVRKRGIAEQPQTLEKRFLGKRSYGDRTITLLAARIGDRHVGILAEQDL